MWLFVFYLVVNQAQVSITLFYALLFTSTYKDRRINQNPQIEEEQSTQWPKEKGQKDNF
jgi:uncharacterized membrane protein